LIGVSCWLIDDRFCISIQHLRLHILWHFGTGFAGYSFVLHTIITRAQVLNKQPVLVCPNFRAVVLNLTYNLVYGVSSSLNGIAFKVIQDSNGVEQIVSEPCDMPEFVLPYVKYIDIE